ncbi:MAG TPA: polyprenol monophosphomannose synthase, partial [Caulobacter sp.]|nr:polyprenol monophosphomannose synthase [Caulobacter sp.]
MRIADQTLATVADTAPFPAHAGYELSIIIPTLNERENLRALSQRLECALRGIAWQAIIVDDDSGDGTASAAKALAVLDARFSCLRRIGRRGLAGAVIEGVMASAAPFIAVLDADLQHDESLLSVMLESVRNGQADVAVASRFVRREDSAVGLSPLRRLGSLAANGLARRILGQSLSDPMSGFFVTRRSVFDETASRLSPQGFKILFDLLATRRGQLSVREFPYAFRPRVAGSSKLDHRVTAEFLGLALAKTTRDLLSPRAAVFLAVGASGLVVHL